MFVPIEVVTFFLGIVLGIIGSIVYKDIFDDSVY